MIAAVGALLLAAAPTQFDQLARQAAAARESNRGAAAVRLYRRAVSLRPAWAEGWWYIGALLYETDRCAGAVPAFTRFLKLEPQSPHGLIMLGVCEYRLKQYDQALRRLVRAQSFALPPTDAIGQAGRYHRAILSTHFARFDAALDELKKFTFPAVESPAIIQAIGTAALRLPLLPDELPADRRGLVVKTGRAVYDSWAAHSEDAAREFSELILSYPDNPHLRFLYGSFLLQGDSNGGIRELGKCLELDPKYVPAMLQLAFEYLTLGEPAKGIPFAERAAKLDPESFVPHNALGRLLLAAGDLPGAIAELETAVKLAPQSPECHYALASAYARAGRKQQAAQANAEFMRIRRLRGQATGK